MPTLKPDATAAQAAQQLEHLAIAERELRQAVAETRGLRLGRSGQLVRMIRTLQITRLELEGEVERMRAARTPARGSAFQQLEALLKVRVR